MYFCTQEVALSQLEKHSLDCSHYKSASCSLNCCAFMTCSGRENCFSLSLPLCVMSITPQTTMSAGTLPVVQAKPAEKCESYEITMV